MLEENTLLKLCSAEKYIMFCELKRNSVLALRVIHLYDLQFWLCLHVAFQEIFLSGSQCKQIIGSITESCSSDLLFVKSTFIFSSEINRIFTLFFPSFFFTILFYFIFFLPARTTVR